MKSFRILALAGALSLFFGCVDSLEVTNKNQPDTERVLVTPGDIEALIKGSFRQTWRRTEHWYGPMHMTTMADELSSSWGNVGMKDASSEPRVAFNNATSYTYRRTLEDPWYGCYRAISAVNDAFAQILGTNAVEIGDNGDDTDRAVAYGRLVQGMSYSWLACFFDKAFLVDETTDLEAGGLELQPYADVMTYGLGFLQDAIDIATAAKPFTIDGWINGVVLDNAGLIELAHSYMARYMAQVARTPAERAAVNWTAVKTHAEKGFSADWGPMGDGFILWYSNARWAAGQDGWTRADYKTIGITDTSGNYQAWLDAGITGRDDIYIYPKDRRVTGVTSDPESDGLYFQFVGASPFRSSRGKYHYSMYMTSIWDLFSATEDTRMVTFNAAEMDFLVAEAEFRAGGAGLAAAATIINNYGVTNGALPAVSGTDSDLFDWLKYNKRIETYALASGLAYYDDRGWGDLVTGTAIHFPVPAKELEVSVLDVYTFGGDQGSAAPKSFPDGKEGRQ